ncbi:MAG TPA: tetratricopeptide repeat protein [Ktedonobacteraceae bacterium]
MGRRLGLIIGVNSYQDATFRPLQFAETDARALAQWLVHNRGGKWNPADVQVLQGAEATLELVESLVMQLCLQMVTSEDMIFIYFAGYAFVDQVSGEGQLACYNTRYQQSGSGLNLLALVSQVMARSPAAQIFCVLDCFQFGSVWNMRRGSLFDYKPLLGPALLNGLQQMQGRLLYCTCRGNEARPEVSEKNLGSFMYRMIMGVGGPAIDPGTGQITLQRLHAFLSERLNEQHKPQVFGQEQRPLVLVGEMPSFKAGGFILSSGPLSGDIFASEGSQLGSIQRSGSVAQISPADSGFGQATMATVEQNRLQQCQQMLSQAMQVFQAQNYQQAYQMAEMILQINPDFTDALILKAQTLAATGQFQEALSTIQETVQRDPENALGWSMAAALLANLNQFPEAMSAVDRSISIDPSNSETHSIKEMIREKLAEVQFDTGKRSRLLPAQRRVRDTGKSFALAVGIQLLALIIGVAGAAAQLVVPSLPTLVPIALESLALALLAVNAGRGAFLYGFRRFGLTFVFTLISAGLAVGLYFSVVRTTPMTHSLLNLLLKSYNLLQTLTILFFWLCAAALVPFLVGLIGLIAHFIRRASGRRK